MTWLLALATKAPTWVKLGAAFALVLVALQVRHSFELRSERKKTSTAIAERDAARTELADVRIALSTAVDVNARFALSVDRQKAAIAELESRAKSAETAAALAAVRALKRGTETATELRSPATTVKPGDAAMNQWLQERFAGGGL